MRHCTACGESKPVEAFGRDVRAADGCKAKCRLCEKAYMREWQLRNPDRVKALNAKWVRENPEKKREVDARRSKDARRSYARRSDVMERAREFKRGEYARRRDVLLARVKSWTRANREKRRAYASKPQMRLHGNVSRAIRAAIRLNKAGRGWERLVGYTRADLMAHLERQFTDGMSWANYGQWEIDHIRPRASFAFTTAEDPQFSECWALSNLQPLWMATNRRKHARYEAA